MALPANLTTVTVSHKHTNLGGAAMTGTVTWTSSADLLSDSEDTTINASSIRVALDLTGAWSVVVPVVDDPDVEPNGWTYTVTFNLTDPATGLAVTRTQTVQVTASMAPVIDWGELVPATLVAETSPYGRLAVANTWTQDQTFSGALRLSDPATLPATDPTGGGTLFADAGALKWRSPGGIEVLSGGATPLSVKAYGAVGDGVADDSAAIQAAINTAAVTKSIVFLPPGLYKIGTPLLIDADIEMCGEGWNTVLKLGPNVNDYVIKFGTSQGDGNTIKLRKFRVDGNQTQQTTDGGCILANNAVWSVFDELHLHHAFDVALFLRGQQGAFGGQFGHHNHVSRCLFDNGADSPGNGQGLRIISCDENYIVDCDFEFNGGGGAEPFHVKDWSGLNSFVSCVFVGGGTGIKFQDVSGSRVIGCMFDAVGGHALDVTGSQMQIVGNNFFGTRTLINTNFHIFMQFGGYNAISGNIFSSGGGEQLRAFISQGPSSTNNTVTGNTFRVDGAVGIPGGYDWNGSNARALNTKIRGNVGLPDDGQGVVTLTAGSAVVADTSVTANSLIFLTAQTTGGTPGFLGVSTRTPGTSFTITSSSGTDTSTVAYQIFEP